MNLQNFYAALVTAPSDADETSFAYFAITPVVYRGAGGFHCARRSSRLASTSSRLALHVQSDHVAIAQQSDRAAARGFRRNVADHQTVRRAAETAIGDQRDRFTDSWPTRAPVTASISRMPGPPLGPS